MVKFHLGCHTRLIDHHHRQTPGDYGLDARWDCDMRSRGDFHSIDPNEYQVLIIWVSGICPNHGLVVVCPSFCIWNEEVYTSIRGVCLGWGLDLPYAREHQWICDCLLCVLLLSTSAGGFSHCPFKVVLEIGFRKLYLWSWDGVVFCVAHVYPSVLVRFGLYVCHYVVDCFLCGVLVIGCGCEFFNQVNYGLFPFVQFHEFISFSLC